ncbi:MAG: Transglutaminase-like protein [Rhodocyclaceae bacterium]|nr:Transglutaminase-like protein [Rhodocyclaceae bacterium]
MSTAAPETLDRSAVPWLFATALATTLPHFAHQPTGFSALAGLLFAWGAWLWWRGRRLPSRWLLALLVAGSCAGVVLEFHTLLGRDAGVAMLFLFMAMKLLELRSRRDAYVVINLGYFLLLTHYFHSQSIGTGLWLLGAMVIVTATLIRLHGGRASTPGPTLRYAGLMILQSLPFLLVLYLLFPRVSGPLWGLPQDAAGARSGLSDQMSPGSIADLALSTDIAFRARFDAPLPKRDQLYWRGPVMEDYDGITWRRGPIFGPAPAVVALSAPLNYEITLEPYEQRWLLALDAPTALPPESGLTPSLSAVSRGPLSQRLRYAVSSALSYRFNTQESAAVLKRDTLLPAGRNPRARALAETWRRTGANPEGLVQRALALFHDQEFAYTLHPPLLGQNPVDEFLFQTRRGFCEHYASAFVVLMRAAGVPARVVGGYQGGEINPVDGYLVVRQSDAHAWAEVWLAGRGWVRVDPTAAVSPARVEDGLAASVPATRSLPALMGVDASWLRGLRYRWEAANNAWNQWVLGYNPQRQREFLTSLGFPDPNWRTLAPVLLAACGSILLAVTAWTLYRRPHRDPAQRLWQRALRRLRRRQVSCEPWETPLALARRLRSERPELAEALEAAAEIYCQARYGTGPANLRALRAAVARLP